MPRVRFNGVTGLGIDLEGELLAFEAEGFVGLMLDLLLRVLRLRATPFAQDDGKKRATAQGNGGRRFALPGQSTKTAEGNGHAGG